jgi:hypothetical protein
MGEIITAPIFVFDEPSGDFLLFETLDAAECGIETIDALSGTNRAYDANGLLLEISVEGRSTRIRPGTSRCREHLADRLRKWLDEVFGEDFSAEGLDEIVRRALEIHRAPRARVAIRRKKRGDA